MISIRSKAKADCKLCIMYINEYTNKIIDLNQPIVVHNIYILHYFYKQEDLFKVFWYLSDNFDLEKLNSFLLC